MSLSFVGSLRISLEEIVKIKSPLIAVGAIRRFHLWLQQPEGNRFDFFGDLLVVCKIKN
jgi:hypothetical protein